MRKSELIAVLQKMDGDPLVLVDVDGNLSDDVHPVLYEAQQNLIDSIDPLAVGRLSKEDFPKVGDPVILI